MLCGSAESETRGPRKARRKLASVATVECPLTDIDGMLCFPVIAKFVACLRALACR